MAFNWNWKKEKEPAKKPDVRCFGLKVAISPADSVDENSMVMVVHPNNYNRIRDLIVNMVVKDLKEKATKQPLEEKIA